MGVYSEQWITATERKKKNVCISGTENKLYLCELVAGKHLLIHVVL